MLPINPTAVLGSCHPPSSPTPGHLQAGCAVGKAGSKTGWLTGCLSLGLRLSNAAAARCQDTKPPIGDLAPRGLLLGCFGGGHFKSLVEAYVVCHVCMYVRWGQDEAGGLQKPTRRWGNVGSSGRWLDGWMAVQVAVSRNTCECVSRRISD